MGGIMNRILFYGALSGALIVMTLVISGCGNDRSTVDEAPRNVRVSAVTVREEADEVHGFGALSFLKKVDLAAASDAYLERLLYREGDSAPAGAVVAILKNPQISLAVLRAENTWAQSKAALDLCRARLQEGEFQAESQILSIARSEAELDQGRKTFAEQKRKHEASEALFAAGGLSQEAILESRFSLEAAGHQLMLMEKELEIRSVGFRETDLLSADFPAPNNEEERRSSLIKLATAGLRAEVEAAAASLEAAGQERESSRLLEEGLVIRTPAAGIVGARYFEEGERLRQEDKIMTIIDASSLYAVFSVREADAFRLRKGMAATVKLDGINSVCEGAVDLVSPQADSQSFTFFVRVLLPPSSLTQDAGGVKEALKPGMFARISVSLGPPRKIVVIPEASLLSKTDKRGTVFTVSGNTLSEREVGLGESFGDDREIISGLAPGEVVVLRPDGNLREGIYVSAAH
jgi:RND family efflux transporter MFP subunit